MGTKAAESDRTRPKVICSTIRESVGIHHSTTRSAWQWVTKLGDKRGRVQTTPCCAVWTTQPWPPFSDPRLLHSGDRMCAASFPSGSPIFVNRSPGTLPPQLPTSHHAPKPICSPITVESRKRRGFVEAPLPITRGLLYPYVYIYMFTLTHPPIISAPLPPCLAPYWPAFLPVTPHVWGNGCCTVQIGDTLKRRYRLRTDISGAQTWSWRGRFIWVQ